MKRYFFKSNIIIATLALALSLAFLFGCKEEKKVDATFTDERDGKKYKYVKIGEQTWMAENLNYEVEGSLCISNDISYCEKYGRLYNWNMAMKVCPNGWHLPDNAEWDKLYRFVDGNNGTESPYESETAGKYLKAKSGWNDDDGKSGNGEDKFGFNALPSGSYNDENDFDGVGESGFWWNASEYIEGFAYGRRILLSDFAGYFSTDKTFFHSVRCLKD